MKIIVLGSGCKKCTNTAEFIKSIADKNNISVDVVKETNLEIIISYGVMSTPAIVIDDKVVHAGSIPEKTKVEGWIK